MRRKVHIKPTIQRLVQEARKYKTIDDDLDAYLDSLTFRLVTASLRRNLQWTGKRKIRSLFIHKLHAFIPKKKGVGSGNYSTPNTMNIL